MTVSHYTTKYSKERLSHCILSTCMIVIQYYIQSLLLHGFFFFQQKGESTVSHCSLYFYWTQDFFFHFLQYDQTFLNVQKERYVD